MSSNIPAARQLLHEALKHNRTSAEMRAMIVDALKMMKRERHKPIRARSSMPGLNPALAEEIRQYVRMNPHASTLRVAEIFGVNPGRVSEAIAGRNE